MLLVLTAVLGSGLRVEAERDLPVDDYRCPVCGESVILKRGRVRVAHFAHRVRTDCLAAAGESYDHLTAKRVLADGLRDEAYAVTLEETHVGVGRRIDVSVTMPEGARIAVEVQDSAISVTEMKRRNQVDSRLGFAATMWVFTRRRAASWLDVLDRNDWEARLPEEMRYLDNLHQNGVYILDGTALLHATFGIVTRVGEVYYEPGTGYESYSSDRTLRATRQVMSLVAASFRIGALDTKFGRTATFTEF